MNSENIHVNTLYGRYVFMIEELPIMIEAIEKNIAEIMLINYLLKRKFKLKI